MSECKMVNIRVTKKIAGEFRQMKEVTRFSYREIFTSWVENTKIDRANSSLHTEMHTAKAAIKQKQCKHKRCV